jgi:hypothetical protein
MNINITNYKTNQVYRNLVHKNISVYEFWKLMKQIL